MRITSWPIKCAMFAIFFAMVSETSAQSTNLQIKGPRDAQSQYSGATYGPIDASDTLWRISSRYRQNQALSVYQVMVGIYELNPEAFEQENLNLLVDGAVLRLPSERYIARIDPAQALARAQQDDQTLARGSQSSTAEPTPNTNIKPPSELVKKSDLNDTKTQIERQITRLDEQQVKQFELLRQQFAASIDNVQALIDENRKVFERLDAVNQDISDLRSQVDEQVTPQIDQQIELQQELLTLIKDADARQQEKEASSWTQYVTNPLTLIIGSTLLVLLLVGGFIFWLLKRNSNKSEDSPVITNSPIANNPMATQPEVDDLSDSLVEDLAIPDADDDLFNDDELLDDVLSEELEESLDDAVENELENYADLSDEMLVPDIDDDADSLFEDDDDELLKELDDVDIDIDELDSIDLSDDNDIDLADSISDDIDEDLLSELEDDSLDDLFEEDELSGIDTDLIEELTGDDDIDAILDADIAQQIDSSDADLDEQPEISIDELLDDSAGADETPAGIDIDVETGVSSQMLGQLEEEVASQNAAIDKVSDEILGELEQLEMMQGMMGDDDLMDDDPEESAPEASAEVQQDIQSLDDFASDLDDVDIDDLGELDDPLSDDLLNELGATQELDENVVDENDALADELLAELGVDSDENGETPAIDDSDALADELIAELDVENNDTLLIDDTDALADELLAELDGEETDTDVLADELLDELNVDDIDGVATEDTSTKELLAEQQPESVDNSENAIEELDVEEAQFDLESDESLDAELEEIPSFAMDETLEAEEEFSIEEEIDDSLLESALEEFDLEDDTDTFEVEEENVESTDSETVDELDDLPGLGDWLGTEATDDSVVLEEIEGADFDDLLESIDSEVDGEPELKLDNPDLDLDALFTEPEERDTTSKEEDFLDVDTLLEESVADEGTRAEETDLNLDVALSEFSGVSDDDVVVDVDEGGVQAANLDLAQAYIEMDDKEAASELLKEVIHDGSEEQKLEAQAILDKLT